MLTISLLIMWNTYRASTGLVNLRTQLHEELGGDENTNKSSARQEIGNGQLSTRACWFPSQRSHSFCSGHKLPDNAEIKWSIAVLMEERCESDVTMLMPRACTQCCHFWQSCRPEWLSNNRGVKLKWQARSLTTSVFTLSCSSSLLSSGNSGLALQSKLLYVWGMHPQWHQYHPVVLQKCHPAACHIISVI